MAPKRKTRQASASESDDAYVMADSFGEDEEHDERGDKTITLDAAPIPTLPTFSRPLHVHPVSRAACRRSGTVTASNGTRSTVLGPNTSEPSNDVEDIGPFWVVYTFVVIPFQIPVTRSDLRLFKETIQLELDGAINAINEAANIMKTRLVGTSLGFPAHRKPAHLEFQKLICEHALALMKRENKHSPFTNVPNRAEVISYMKGTQRPCCTADNFRVDLSDTPASAWNTSASHVFAASFCDAHPGCDRSLKAIFDAWVVHFSYLRQVYAKQQMVAREEQARVLDLASGYTNEQDYKSPLAGIHSVHRRRERKLQLYNRRLRMAHRHSGSYPSAVNVVQQLGPTGMSSDESEHDVGHGERIYHITHTLRVLDKLHLRMRYQEQWNATADAWPHLRTPSSQVSNRKPLSGLPKNFYAQDYLSSLTSEGLDDLLLQEDMPLDIPQAIAVLAGPYDVFDRQTALGSAGRCS
ncbi:hypothetical protein EDD15DRAFT_2365258 [Pisolithus albus]|nr:hypothetical protein EDD15DRAFT_2365258 [Pisolithus albus]